MCNNDFDTSSGFRFGKNECECSVHIYSSTWINLLGNRTELFGNMSASAGCGPPDI